MGQGNGFDSFKYLVFGIASCPDLKPKFQNHGTQKSLGCRNLKPKRLMCPNVSGVIHSLIGDQWNQCSGARWGRAMGFREVVYIEL